MGQFLPINRKEMEERGWQEVDFVYICGDAYVDHPSFGAAIICRTLEANGFKVAFLSQPDWHKVEEFRQFGKPRLGFLISSGNIDSMVNHYTVSKKRRHKDSYTSGGEGFKRPDRAVIVYSQMARQAFPDANILIGGIEASLRRLAHYDYWSDKVRKSIIIDANADLLMFGMTVKRLSQYRRKHLGYVFQMYNLIPNLTVRENIEVGAYLSDHALDVDELLDTLGLSAHQKKLPNQLSGGQQQRTAIGRAIVKNPDILLCDEPTGALDYKTSKEILKLIETVNQKYGNTVVMVTHNDAIKDMADHVVRIRDGMVRKNYLNDHKVTAQDLDW